MPLQTPPNIKMDADSTEVLDQFLSEWKTELKVKGAQLDLDIGASKDVRDEATEEPARKHYCQMPSDDIDELNRADLNCSSHESSASSAVIGVPSLFVLPAGGTIPSSATSHKTKNITTGVHSQVHSSTSTVKTKSHGSLIDTLITDLVGN